MGEPAENHWRGALRPWRPSGPGAEAGKRPGTLFSRNRNPSFSSKTKCLWTCFQKEMPGGNPSGHRQAASSTSQRVPANPKHGGKARGACSNKRLSTYTWRKGITLNHPVSTRAQPPPTTPLCPRFIPDAPLPRRSEPNLPVTGKDCGWLPGPGLWGCGEPLRDKNDFREKQLCL